MNYVWSLLCPFPGSWDFLESSQWPQSMAQYQGTIIHSLIFFQCPVDLRQGHWRGQALQRPKKARFDKQVSMFSSLETWLKKSTPKTIIHITKNRCFDWVLCIEPGPEQMYYKSKNRVPRLRKQLEVTLTQMPKFQWVFRSQAYAGISSSPLQGSLRVGLGDLLVLRNPSSLSDEEAICHNG